MSMMIVAALVGLGLRMMSNAVPWGLLLVNLTGSFTAGLLGGLKLPSNTIITAGIVGFCGCLTTFSGYALENVKLFEQGEIFKIVLNLVLHNALCLLMCYAGWQLAQKL